MYGMTKTSDLPIYKSTYDVLIIIMNLTHHFSREYKYTLGEKLQKEMIDLILTVYHIYDKKKINTSMN